MKNYLTSRVLSYSAPLVNTGLGGLAGFVRPFPSLAAALATPVRAL